VIRALNLKGLVEALEHLRGVRDFVDVFPDKSPGMSLERALEFTIDLKLRTEPITRTPYRMSTLEL
jgi:hypothetical protein